MPVNKACQLCGSDQQISFHHLIPRTCHKNKWFTKRFSKEDMRSRGIDVCRLCHNFIHSQYDEKMLGRHFNTIEALLDDEGIKKYVAWAKKRLPVK